MKRIIKNIANWFIALNERKAMWSNTSTAYLNKGNHNFIFGAIIFGAVFIYLSYSVYESYQSIWIALIPIFLFVVIVFSIMIRNSYEEQMKHRNRGSRMKLVGFNMDFNEHILKRIYGSLTQYEYLDENLTSFQDFYNVLILDFDEHDSVLHFICTQPQLKYILEKFKQFKKGVHLVSFERSQKIYHKGNLISAETLSKKYNEFPPDHEFEQRIDSFFDFLGDI